MRYGKTRTNRRNDRIDSFVHKIFTFYYRYELIIIIIHAISVDNTTARGATETRLVPIPGFWYKRRRACGGYDANYRVCSLSVPVYTYLLQEARKKRPIRAWPTISFEKLIANPSVHVSRRRTGTTTSVVRGPKQRPWLTRLPTKLNAVFECWI